MNAVVNDSASPVRPVIGVCARTAPVRLQGEEMVVGLALQSHVDFLAAAGCAPLLVPLLPGVERLVSLLDGLLLPGGPDVDPELYGAAGHPATRAMSPDADRAELALLGAALDVGLPVLGICRGMQLLNVLCGGTLHQHLPDVVGDDRHSPRGTSYTLGRQRLKLEPGSRIAGVLDEAEPESACHHHQAVDRLGAGLVATGWAADGTVEVIEAAAHPFAVGVQGELGQTSDARVHHALARAAQHPRGG